MTGTIWQCTWTSVDSGCYTEEEWEEKWMGRRLVVIGPADFDVPSAPAWNVLVGGDLSPEVAYLYEGRLVLGFASGDTEWQQVEAE